MEHDISMMGGKPPLYRFELAFNGKPMGIGMMCGLDEIGLPEGVAINIEEDFNDVPFPQISAPSSFWFTEYALKELGYTLDYLAEHSRPLNWQLIYAKFPEGDWPTALYEDKYQVAFPAEAVSPQYKPFESMRSLVGR